MEIHICLVKYYTQFLNILFFYFLLFDTKHQKNVLLSSADLMIISQHQKTKVRINTNFFHNSGLNFGKEKII